MHTLISTPCSNALHRSSKNDLLPRLVEVITLDKGLDVEPRSADDERQIPLRLMDTNELRHACNKLRYGEWLIRLQYVDEMMRDTSLLLCGRLCAANVEPAIDAHGVARDDVRPQFLCKLQRKLRLSDRRWSDEDEQRAF